MDDATKEYIKKTLKMSEADLDKVPRGFDKTLAGLKAGDRYVFQALPTSIIAQESGPLCIRALGPLMAPVNAMLDRLVTSRDPNKGLFTHAQCYDPGLEHGGLGHVHFR